MIYRSQIKTRGSTVVYNSHSFMHYLCSHNFAVSEKKTKFIFPQGAMLNNGLSWWSSWVSDHTKKKQIFCKVVHPLSRFNQVLSLRKNYLSILPYKMQHPSAGAHLGFKIHSKIENFVKDHPMTFHVQFCFNQTVISEKKNLLFIF